VSDVPSLRQDMSNGTLALLPFTPAMYRQDVHSAVYRCLATNDVGAIVSRDVHVRAGECTRNTNTFTERCFPILTFLVRSRWVSGIALHAIERNS
jgi:hypothetical protein